MDWQDFLRQEAGKHGLSPEQEETLLAALPHENAQISQVKLANELQITEAAVKSRLKIIYDKFRESCPALANQEGAGKFELLRTYLKKNYYQPNINRVIPNSVTSSTIPAEFEPLIKEKIRSFCGRGFVFKEFAAFLNKYPKGYFTVIGDAGMGKSAIAAKYVDDHKAICYFNVLQDGRNRPELFLKSIRQQLINRYQLENAESDDLSALLVKASSKILEGERLVIVVDALDEVEQEPGGENILYLPKTLPDKVYFLLTRRRFEPSKKRLYTEGVEQVELNLTANQYIEFSRDDIQAYIRLMLNNDPDYKDGLRKWIQEKDIADETFIEKVAEKSENNFMYLYYVLPAIAHGLYNDFTLKELPDGLQQYYQTHWARMGMDDKSQEIKVIILFILVEIGTPIPCEMIADIAGKDEFDVQQVLDDWFEYLKKQNVDGDVCYSIYHASFFDFLQAKKDFKATRRLFTKVNQGIVDYWEKNNSNL
jgi:hypothetical protein